MRSPITVLREQLAVGPALVVLVVAPLMAVLLTSSEGAAVRPPAPIQAEDPKPGVKIQVAQAAKAKPAPRKPAAQKRPRATPRDDVDYARDSSPSLAREVPLLGVLQPETGSESWIADDVLPPFREESDGLAPPAKPARLAARVGKPATKPSPAKVSAPARTVKVTAPPRTVKRKAVKWAAIKKKKKKTAVVQRQRLAAVRKARAVNAFQIAARPKARPKARRTAPRAKAARKGFGVQFGAFRSKTGARQEARRLARAHKAVIGDLKIRLIRAERGRSGVVYLLQQAPFRDRAAAARRCRKLSARKQGCMVVKP